MDDDKRWLKTCLEKIPHGEEGELQLDMDDAINITKILLKKGYTVLFSSGDIGDDVKISWIYAGDTGDVDYANIDNICYTHMDYLRNIYDTYGIPERLEEEGDE